MTIFKRIAAYKTLSNGEPHLRKYSFTKGASAQGIIFDANVPGMEVSACREVIMQMGRPFDTKYSVQVKRDTENRRNYNGLFAMLMFDLCQKKYNAGKQK